MGIKVSWLGVAVFAVGCLITNSNFHEGIMIAGVIILVCGVVAMILDK